MNELVSIIIPIYNVEKYMDRCVTSVVRQSYSNIEILLIDDGSTDKSGCLCEQWKQKDNRIIVVHKKNGGPSDARNHGIKIATGEYISFIDSDDFVDRRFIEILCKEINKTGAQIAVVGVRNNSDGDEITEEDYSPECTELFDRTDAIRCLLKEDRIYDYACNKLYRRDLFDDIEYPFGRMMEDLGTTYKLFNKARSVAYNPCMLYYYYQRADSILHVTGQKFYEDKLFMVSERFNELRAEEGLYIDNAYFLFRAIIDCYPHLCAADRISVKEQLKELWKACKSACSYKNRVKYYLILFFEKMYIRMYQYNFMKRCISGCINTIEQITQSIK